jgi:ribosomal protein L22
MDNTFIDVSLQENYIIYPLINGLSDHDAQLIVLSEVKAFTKNVNVRKNNKEN